MIHSVVDQHQVQILEKIYKAKSYASTPKLTGILRSVLDCSYETVNGLMGDLGTRLRNFSHKIDRENPHPDLFSLFGGELVSDTEGSFSRDMTDTLDLYAYGKAHGKSNIVLGFLKKFVAKHRMFETISNVMDDPEENLLNVRFVPSKASREKIRSRKRTQSINTDLIFKRGVENWDSEPKNFTSYFRGESVYQKDIEDALIRHKHFYDLGLKMMADNISASIFLMQDKNLSSQYYGFNKISLTSASIIAAKQSNYKFTIPPTPTDDVEVVYPKISIDTDQFKYRFFADKLHLFDDAYVPILEFAPRIYTYQELREFTSSDVSKVIDYLERFPEADGHALFDHYWILVAGTNFVSDSGSDGSPEEVLPRDNGTQHLDIELVKRKEIVAILVGERDGECYFISYWN